MLPYVLITVGVLAVFLVLFTARDITLRSQSFVWQVLAIVLVALLPIVGFMIYILIRPSRTSKERELEYLLRELLDRSHEVAEVPSTRAVPSPGSPWSPEPEPLAAPAATIPVTAEPEASPAPAPKKASKSRRK